MNNQSPAANHVNTCEIREAVCGSETNVLDALGIDWRAGRPHIDCPYRDHGGASDWRWDLKAAKARCTCTAGDSIFDVLMKVERIDFEAAKIRVAELVGRTDLIRTGDRQRYQATDANSLLSAPADSRDDRLPIAYLAHRLGVPADAVPVPRTPIVGLKALGYYDPPPSGSRAKPKLVGTFPCAVFGTIAADGRTHAHRIYLAPGGAGKADLGIGPDGHPRDPKKSARIIGDHSTSGRSVLWGDPERAQWIILCEGIETAAAVAFAFRSEIDAGAAAVASAITAGGVEAFQPYPVTKRITIAADRDEAPKNNKPGSLRGEQAARRFAIRHYETLYVCIALPGNPGESIDWLDVLQRDGVAAVRDGLLAAAPFSVTEAEREEFTRSQSLDAELQEIAAMYPLPAMDSRKLVHRHTAQGKVKVHKVVAGDKGPAFVPVATPFGVPARLRHIDQADAYGLRCVVQDMGGRPRAVDFERASLAKMGGAEVRARLLEAGLRVEDDGDVIAVQCLKAADPEREIILIRRPGWHEVPGTRDSIFLCPDGRVIGAPEGLDVELSAPARMPMELAASGSLGEWKQAAEIAVSVPGCPHWTIGVIAGFAGPVLSLTGLNTCGINLSGMSSSGKSTAQRLAASAWSTPAAHPKGLAQSARTTDNAIEAMAQRASGTVLCLDELAHVTGKVAARMIYTIAGGTGKRRMSAEASMREGYSWSTFALLSGECSLEEKVRSDGDAWLAGMAVRIVDVDVSEVNRSVAAETLQRISRIEDHYGHAGPLFVQKLVEHGLHRQIDALRERLDRATRHLAGDVADGATVRAATPFALLLIAGELAKGFGLIPPSTAVDEAVTWAWGRFLRSSDSLALDPGAHAIAGIRAWVAERWDVTIKPTKGYGGASNREAHGWYDDNGVYIPKARIREAAGDALKASHIGKLLHERGLLAQRPEPDRYTVGWVPNIGAVECYALSRSEFGRSEHELNPAIYVVHPGARHG